MKLQINGTERDYQGPSDQKLLWYLRDQLRLTGTKFGCGKGLCGACTVHVNGQPTRSCLLPVAQLAEASITTIEGLAQGEALHPVQQAWLNHSVPQCGYCQPGQIMSASALWNQKKNQITAADIAQHMTGNLCRCGTYNRIRAALLSLAHDETATPDTK